MPDENLDDAIAVAVPARVGAIELMLNDFNGVGTRMSTRGTVRILDATGNVVAIRNGDPQKFMPTAWKAKVKIVLDELRDELATRFGISGT